MEYNNQLSENDKRFADEFSNYVNGKMASPRYDQLTEWACRLAAEAIDHLAENDLYHLPEEYYENHKQ